MNLTKGFGRMADKSKVYWDSCAWLGLLNKESDKLSELEYVWTQAQKGEVEIWTSTISQVEVCKLASECDQIAIKGSAHKKSIMTEDNLLEIENIFNQPFVKRVPLDVEISSRARRLFREVLGLNKVPDAVHLISAIKWDIPTIHTYDSRDLLHLSGKMKTDKGNEIAILEPTEKEPDDLLTPLKGDE